MPRVQALSSIIVQALVVMLIISAASVWLLFHYLPSSFSSTSPLAEINGDSFAHIAGEHLVEDSLFHHEHHHKSIPPYQLRIKYKSEPNPYVKPLDMHYKVPTAMNAKFRSLYPKKVNIWYDDGGDGVEQGHLALGQETTTNTYEGHSFYFTNVNNKNDVIARFTMNKDQALYVIDDPNNPPPKELKEFTYKELQFMQSYFEKNGILWQHYYGPNGPRPPPSLFMWPATKVGEVHSVTSSHGHWTCGGNADECLSLTPVHLELEVISLKPKAFIIQNFLNDFECSEIIRLASSSLKHSIVGDVDAGAFESDTRTSKNTWLPRRKSAVTDTLYRRAADLLQIDENLLHPSKAAEDMQVVHYVNGQKYDSHHDWGVSGYPESRYITLLLYLNDMVSVDAGGETAFPKAADGKGIKVHPGKGSAVLFYNLLEDGNGDDLSLHAALPIKKGEKWLANFWVWDPKIEH